MGSPVQSSVGRPSLSFPSNLLPADAAASLWCMNSALCPYRSIHLIDLSYFLRRNTYNSISNEKFSTRKAKAAPFPKLLESEHLAQANHELIHYRVWQSPRLLHIKYTQKFRPPIQKKKLVHTKFVLAKVTLIMHVLIKTQNLFEENKHVYPFLLIKL